MLKANMRLPFQPAVPIPRPHYRGLFLSQHGLVELRPSGGSTGGMFLREARTAGA